MEEIPATNKEIVKIILILISLWSIAFYIIYLYEIN
jgi:hypothetical protein